MNSSGYNMSSILAKDKNNNFITPKKAILNAIISSDIKQMKTSPKNCDLQEINLDFSNEPFHLLKDRYLLQTTSQELFCTDIYTEEVFLCKLIKNSLPKVQLAYFNLANTNLNENEIIRPPADIVQISDEATYLILRQHHYGDLHTYIKFKRRLPEPETICLFRQICDIVLLCHRNGIVLRDLKLTKFYFIDKERKTLQYESLESAFILDNPENDYLSEKIGCPLYVAPELLTPNTCFAGYAADMWSLGIILFTLLVGRYPFTDGYSSNLFNKIVLVNFTMPHFLSPKARCLLRSLLRKNPDERLLAEDILFHPWFYSKEFSSGLINDMFDDDQVVPDNCSEGEMTNFGDSG